MFSRSIVKLVLVVALLAGIFWPGIERHWQLFWDPYFVPYDASQYVPAFFKFDPIDPIPTTYAKEYFLNAVCPPFYKWLTVLGAQWVDVRQFQMAMVYISYASFILVVGRLGWVLGGGPLCFAFAALTINAWFYLGFGFLGGAPRMFAYPLIALMLDALIRDRPIRMAICTVAAGLVYPVAGAIGGTCLLAWFIVPPFCRVGKVASWSLNRRLGVVTVAGILTSALLLPLVFGAGDYGRRVVAADIVLFPEAGPQGNYRIYDRLPYQLFGPEIFTYFIGPFYGHGDAIAPWGYLRSNVSQAELFTSFFIVGLGAIMIIARGLLLSRSQEDRGSGFRALSFFATCGLLHVVAWLGAPYLYIPTRYFMFSLPFVMTLIFPWSLWLVLSRSSWFHNAPRLSAATFLAIITLFLLAYGGKGNVSVADAIVDRPTRPLFDAIAKLPSDVLIAGWPLGKIRTMEYVTRRNAFLTGDTHQVLHLIFMKKLRARMDALFDAYFSNDSVPLYRLRDEFRVTHLIVDISDFKDAAHPPEYFAPWRDRIVPQLAKIRGQEILLNDVVHKAAAVYQRDGLILLDLARLP